MRRRLEAVLLSTSILFLVFLTPAKSQSMVDRLEGSMQFHLAEAESNADNTERARQLHEIAAESQVPWHSWSGISELVAVYRMTGRGEQADLITAGIARERPELAGLMEIWKGDTAALSGDFMVALKHYKRATTDTSHTSVGGIPIKVHALRQVSRTFLQVGNPAAAASVERDLLRRYPGFVEPELTLARAMAYDAIAAGELPLKSLGGLLHSGDCSEVSPCLASGGRIYRLASGGIELAGLSGIRFSLSREDEALLQSAKAQHKGSFVQSVAEVCAPASSSKGFQHPLTEDHSGNEFMDPISQGYHPGRDINGPGGGDADCDLVFKAVADGCVTDASATPTTWGGATIQHVAHSRTWTSQYGHASAVYYSAGSAISKGATLGLVGRVGAETCHLHHEIREPDHPAPTNADYYSNLTKVNVGDWYQDPLPFISAFHSYLYRRWADESAFSFTGTWNTVSGTGNEDDLRWASTTLAGSKNNYATYTFTPPSSGTYELWAFVPYNYATSTAARYKLARTGGSTIFSGTVNQEVRLDAWVRVGSGYLTGGASYYAEIATNTGETSRRVALDDILIVQISN